jgi:predicted TIM-barrel fold metal-dependent hydrolase
MTKQGLEAVVLFPTLACGLEQALKDDIPATMGSLAAFNRWLDEEWGYDYEGRVFAAPMLSFADPEAAADEVDVLIRRGARIVHVRPAPVPADNGTTRSLGDRRHDPVWARLAEAEVAVGFHLGDSGYNTFAAAWGASSRFEGYGKNDLLSRVLVSDRAIHDTMASLLLHGVFQRHPTLKVASIENGSDWLHLLVKRLRKQRNQVPRGFVEDPLDTLRRHLWLTPYCEEDLETLGQLIGTDRILFGSDWPHGEGLAQPLGFLDVIAGFDDAAKHQIMYENCARLLGLNSVVGIAA